MNIFPQLPRTCFEVVAEVKDLSIRSTYLSIFSGSVRFLLCDHKGPVQDVTLTIFINSALMN